MGNLGTFRRAPVGVRGEALSDDCRGLLGIRPINPGKDLLLPGLRANDLISEAKGCQNTLPDAVTVTDGEHGRYALSWHSLSPLKEDRTGVPAGFLHESHDLGDVVGTLSFIANADDRHDVLGMNGTGVG